MAEPSLALGFENLILEVAEFLGIAYYGSAGTGSAQIPKDSHDLAECKRIVNNGIRRFIADAPLTGWRWMRRDMEVTLVATTYTGTATAGAATTLTDGSIATTYADDFFNTYLLKITDGTGQGETATVTAYDGTLGKFTFTALSGASTPDTTSKYRIVKSTDVIDADRSRYLLGEYFGGVADGQIHYLRDTGHSTPIQWRSEGYINASRAANVLSGYPTAACIRPYQPTTYALASTRKWELFVDPQPSAADVLIFPYTLYFDNMQLECGLATGGTAATLLDSARKEADDYFNDWVLTIISGTGLGQTATITSYAEATGTFGFTALSGGSTPDTTSQYKVEPAANLHPAGFRFDDAILSACLMKAEERVPELGQAHTQSYMQIDLMNAMKIDMRSAPRTLGNLGGQPTRDRNWTDVVTDNDI